MQKQFLLIAGVLSLALHLHGQGTVSMRNTSATAVTDASTGQRVPAGGTFRAALFVAPDGVTDDSQYAMVGTPVIFYAPGLFSSGTITVTIAPPGAFVMFQVRVWDTAYGSTYEAALAAPSMNGRRALTGKSNQMRGRLANPTTVPPQVPTDLGTGLQAFSVSALPDPSFSINDVVVSEGTNGLKVAIFTVTLMPPSHVDASVDFATADGTALAGSDYVATNGTLTFAAGETTRNVAVTVTGDFPAEPDETLYVNLSNAGEVPFVKPQGECVITEVRVTGVRIDVARSFNTVANQHYMLERSDDGITWTVVAGAEDILGTGGVVSAYDPGAGCQTFRLYRARLAQ